MNIVEQAGRCPVGKVIEDGARREADGLYFVVCFGVAGGGFLEYGGGVLDDGGGERMAVGDA